MSTHAGRELGEDSSRASFKTLRRLTSTPTHERTLALFGSEEREVVVERLALASLDDAHRTQLVTRAKGLGAVVSPHLPRIVETRVTASELSFVSAASQGDWLSELAADEARQKTRFLALAVELRIVLDVLAGLSAMHAYRGVGAPLIHGAVAPCNVFVGVDGHTIVSGALRMPGASPAGAVGYLAPEIMLGDGTADTRADIYSACVLLWEALSGKRLFVEKSSEEILSRQLSAALPRAVVREPWAEPLADVAARGLAVDPAARYATVNEIAQAIRSVAQARLAAPTRVGRTVESLADERLVRRKAARTGSVAPRTGAIPNVSRASGPAAPRTLTAKPLTAAPVASNSIPTPLVAPAAALVTQPDGVTVANRAVHSSGTRRVVRTEDVPTPLVAFSPVGPSPVTRALDEDDLEVAPDSIPSPSPSQSPDPVPVAIPIPAIVGTPPNVTVQTQPRTEAEAPLPTTPYVAVDFSRSETTSTHAVARATPAPPRRKSRATRLALVFLLATGSLFAIVAWAVLRQPPVAPAVSAPVGSAAPAAPAKPLGPRPHPGDPIAPNTPVPPVAEVATAVVVDETPPTAAPREPPSETRPSSHPTPARKGDRPRKARTNAYEPEGI